MKKQVLIYRKPASELKKGDSILTSRMTVSDIDIIHVRATVSIVTMDSMGMNFELEEDVLVVE